MLTLKGVLAIVSISLVAFACSIQLAESSSQEIFLPKDCDVVNIVGNGFKLQLTQLNDLKQQWKETAEEAAAVETPRPAASDDTIVVNTDDNEINDAAPNPNGGAPAKSLDCNGIDCKDFSDTFDQASEQRELDDDLLRWIENRATSLVYRIQRYQNEMSALRANRMHPNKVVLDILLLNTLVDLDNLINENIPKMQWLKMKMHAVGGSNIERRQFAYEVLEFVNAKIGSNYKLERALRGKNNPGDPWLLNTQAIRRVLHEQRFSKQIGQICVDHLKGSFNMMQRSRVFELNKPPTTLDDGLFYARAKGQVPVHFPFASQDAIVNGAYV